MKRRAVITGLGVISSAGIGKDKFWENFKQGKSHTHRTTRFALAATELALKDAKLKIDNEDPQNVGISIGIAVFGIDFTEEQMRILYRGKGLKGVSPYSVIAIFCCAPMGQISIRYKITGYSQTYSNGCTAGLDSIGTGFQAIRDGKADIIIAGGTDAPVTPHTHFSFDVVKCLSRKRNHEPEKASRPFDKDRDGFVLGEGCGLLILEELERARKRGAPIYAEVIGYGNTGNGYHMTAPAPDGLAAARALNIAIEDAGIRPEEVDYISAHGSSTPLNEKAETLIIKEIFKEHAYKLKISSIKSMIGHPLGAAGAFQGIAAALTIKNGIIPPTINYEYPDPDCDLDCTPNRAVEKKVKTAMLNGFGFSGRNAAVIMREFTC